jgi:uncharacterized protein
VRASKYPVCLGVAAALLVACDRDDVVDVGEPRVEFSRAEVRIEAEADTFIVQVEIAETAAQRQMGLMRRDSLPEEAGMIFLFQDERPPDEGFWMFNTYIPLSIAFLDGDGRIVRIREMEPCPSPYPQWCPTYEAGAPHRAALEMNRGYFAQRGIGVGDRVVLER